MCKANFLNSFTPLSLFIVHKFFLIKVSMVISSRRLYNIFIIN